MRTVSTLCASGAGIGVSALGFSLVTSADHSHTLCDSPSYSSTRTPSRDMSLTTTAVFTFSANSNSSPTYRLTSPLTQQSRANHSLSSPLTHNSLQYNPPFNRSVSENAALTLKSSASSTRPGRSRISLPGSAVDTSGGTGRRRRSFATSEEPITPGDRLSTRRVWLRRLSNSMSSRESSRPPSSRPTSAAVSHSNGSIAFSNPGSITPFFPPHTPTQLPPNKLVKRSTSVRSFASQTESASKLPRPTFKRPATSHQRSSLSQRRPSTMDQADRVIDEATDGIAREAALRPYFVPRVAADAVLSGRKRATSIPNPIKRVFPDRRYRPMLVSGNEPVARMMVEVDDGFSSTEGSLIDLALAQNHGAASSPGPLLTSDSHQAVSEPRRSFSIGDMLSTGPQALWKSTSSNRGRLVRRSRRRVSSTSNSDMGSALSIADVTDSERPNKRREVIRDGLPGAVDGVVRSPHDAADASQSQLPNVYSTSSRSSSRGPAMANVSTLQDRGITHESNRNSDMIDIESDSNTDYQSDMLFDSIPTRTTRSSSGRRGPPIDTIFDDTPPTYSSGRSTKLADYLSQDNVAAAEKAYRYSTIEEEESVATPVRSLRDGSLHSSPAAARGNPRSLFSSSPPLMSTMPTMPDLDNINWDAFDDSTAATNEPETPTALFPSAMKRLPLRFAPALRQGETISSTSTPIRNGASHTSIFDWSEVQPSPSHNHSPPRPRTVHGKKDSENRSSRAPTRRTPSAMHSRSHSVPVVPDGEGKRNAGHNKFGTWGVGSKAVTEDWNEDFDFDDMEPQHDQSAEPSEAGDKRIDSGHEMLIPVAIREQQQNVVANIGLLREWGLLIEELKELRMRAVALNMLSGLYAQAWAEVDAMIELADQESEEHTLEPRRSPPSSPGFDYSAFEEAIPDLHQQAGGAIGHLPEPLLPFTPLAPIQQTKAASPTRPRKDSEAVARSVIEALRQKRSVPDSPAMSSRAANKKVPFDTATLRHIVPYVSNLRAKVKEALRETEGLYKSPERSRNAEALAGATRDGSPVSRRLRQQYDGQELDGFDDLDEDNT